jgi:cytochrome c'
MCNCRLVIASTAAAALLGVLSGAFAQSKTTKRAPPPKFDPKKVEQTFFADARKELKGPRPSGVAMTATANKNSATTADRTDNSTATAVEPAAGAVVWSRLISAETLVDEIKSYQPLLAEKVKTPSVFKSANQEVRRYFSVLATMFAIAAQHDGEVRWKNQAAAAREIFAKAGFNAKAADDRTFNESKQRTEDLAGMLRGESIQSPPNIEPAPEFAKQVAARAMLMRRLEEAFDKRLKGWTGSPDNFAKNLNAIKHEAEVVAALSQVILHPSYVDADSEDYRGYALSMQTNALAIVEAAKQKNAEQARTAAGQIHKACTSCHGDFR